MRSQYKPSPEGPDWVKPINRLSSRDVSWLELLSCGVNMKSLYPRSEGYTKYRMASIRQFLQARTTTQAVVIALRKGIIK